MAALEERLQGLCTASEASSDSWGISSTYSHSEAQAKLKLKQLRQEINAVDDNHLHKILTFFDDHWDQASAVSAEKGDGEAPAWVKLRVGDASAAQTGEKP